MLAHPFSTGPFPAAGCGEPRLKSRGDLSHVSWLYAQGCKCWVVGNFMLHFVEEMPNCFPQGLRDSIQEP